MMKNSIYIFAALAALVSVASCKKEVIPDELDINSDDGQLSIAALGGNVSLSVSANNPVTLTIDAEWLEANIHEWTPDPEKKSKSIFFYADANESVDERTATVTFKAGSLTKTREILQAGKTTIIADENDFVIDEKGGEIQVPVRTNVKCSVDTRCDWISLSETKALEDRTFVLAVEENTTENVRSANVLISGLGESRSITVTQSAGPVLELKDASVSFDAAGSRMMEITVRTNVGLKAVTVPEWISLDFEAPEINAGDPLTSPVNIKVQVRSASNVRHEIRNGEICLGGVARDGLTAGLSVNQEAAPFCVYYTTTERSVGVPLFYGSDLSGTVIWGDGSTSSYKANIFHNYIGTGEHTVCVTVGAADRVRFDGIKNITRIDLRSF